MTTDGEKRTTQIYNNTHAYVCIKWWHCAREVYRIPYTVYLSTGYYTRILFVYYMVTQWAVNRTHARYVRFKTLTIS